ncbi:MAG: hypothetical protein ACMV0I_00610 [Pseudomonas sp.]
MPDELDRASDYEEAHRAFCVQNAIKQIDKPNGRCQFCSEPVDGERLYCDIDCAADHEREKAARRRAGVYRA